MYFRRLRGSRGLDHRLLGARARRGANGAEERREELVAVFIIGEEATNAPRLFIVGEQEREGARLVALPQGLIRGRHGAEQAEDLVGQAASVGLVGLAVILLVVIDIAGALSVGASGRSGQADLGTRSIGR